MLERQLREAGLEEIADPSRYTIDGGEDGPRLQPPEARLIAMLEAYERHLASYDRHALDIALKDINTVLDEGELFDAQFVPVLDGDTPLASRTDASVVPDGSFSLMSAPELRELRTTLLRFINELREDDVVR